MSSAGLYICEVKMAGVWQAATLAEALSVYRIMPRRCPACHGPVAVTGAYGGVRRATIVHRREHAGCPLKPKLFNGTATPHPDAME